MDGIGKIVEAQGGQAKSYVVRGAKTKCTLGSSSSWLNMPCSHGVYLRGQPQLNIMDYVPNANIVPFGKCKKRQKCSPNTTPWIEGKNDVLIENQPALLNTSTSTCSHGGIITITNDGQE